MLKELFQEVILNKIPEQSYDYGLPSINVRQYRDSLSPNLNPEEIIWKDFYHKSDSFECGRFTFWVTEYTGHPIPLAGNDTMKNGDHYINLHLDACENLNEALFSVKQLAQFIYDYTHVEWLVGSSWLGSVDEGKLIERFGFHATEKFVPFSVYLSSKMNAYERKSFNRRYKDKVRKSEVKFIYASREEFLVKNTPKVGFY